jgi:hypothetical protein
MKEANRLNFFNILEITFLWLTYELAKLRHDNRLGPYDSNCKFYIEPALI